MSFLGIHIVTDARMAALKAAAHSVETFALDEGQKVIAAAKDTDLGKAAVSAIAAAEMPGLSGAAKFEQALSVFLPQVLHYATSGGFSGLMKDVESFGRQMLQTVFNDLKSTTAGQVAQAIGKAIGL